MCKRDVNMFFFFSRRRRHTRCGRDWSSDVCSSDLIEAVAGFRLERRRAGTEHPRTVATYGPLQVGRGRGPRRANRRHDPAACCVELLVARSRGPPREFLDTVAREARVRVTVDEAWDGAPAAAVYLTNVLRKRPKVAHPPDGGDRPALAEHEGVLEHRHVSERGAASRRTLGRRRND